MTHSLWDLVITALTRFPQQKAWVRRLPQDRREQFTYAEMRAYALTLAHRLREAGIVPGDRVGILASNGPEWGAAAMAAWKLGAVVAPLHTGNSDEELRTQAQALDGKCILYQHKDRGLPDPLELKLAVDSFAVATERIREPAAGGDMEAVRIYTSGSTGKPKMVRLSHHNIVSNVLAAAKLKIDIGPRDRFLSLLPLSHAMEMTGGMLLPLHKGASIVVPRMLAAGEILEALRAERITFMIGVPRLFRNLKLGMEKQFEDRGLPQKAYLSLLRRLPYGLRRRLNGPIRKRLGGAIKCWLSGGSRLDPEINRFFRDLGLCVIQGYGLTECSPVVAVQNPGDPLLDSVGRPLDGVEVRIHDPDPEGTGELWVRGPNVMLGYVDEEQTRAAMQDGWYKTGDIARLVEDNQIVLTGRCKRLIVTEAGKNVYPEDLEIMLERNPALKEAGVVEVDMEPAAVLAIDPPDQVAKAKAILKDFNARVSSHNRINRFAIVDELPRTPLGKVALKALPRVFSEHEVSAN